MMVTEPSPSAAQTEAHERQVPFLTLRNRTSHEDPVKAFGGERGNLKAGWCRVQDLDLSVLSPLAKSAPSYVREELLRVDQVTEMGARTLLDEFEDVELERPLLVYVHGYYISFEKGCRRAVLLQENADLTGRLLWFSWPSDGDMTNYMHDEADLYWSVPDLAEALIEMEGRFHGRVDVMGHSLGARGVALALQEVATRKPDARLGEIVLLAPDMDFEIFARILPRIAPIVTKVTVYVTKDDLPLRLSAQLHGHPRLGQAGNDVSNLAGVEVIDVSDLPFESPTGHLYHIYNEDVGDDLSQLLNEGKRAAARSNLVKTGRNAWSWIQQNRVEPE